MFRGWPEEDQDYALALMDIHRDTCQGCGQLMSVSTDVYQIDTFTAKGIRCGGCMAVEHAREKANSDDQQDLAGVHFYAHQPTKP